jgi:hypothetical protein|tara:strand:- start:155 stop:328 length:174 start_codon:yes stop_codon:yes gene_type:complete
MVRVRKSETDNVTGKSNAERQGFAIATAVTIKRTACSLGVSILSSRASMLVPMRALL